MQQGRTTPERAGRLCEKSPGHLVAAALAGAWREQPPAGCAVEFEQVVPLLLASGSAGLGWWRVRHSELKASAVGLELQQAYRFSVLRAAFLRSQIKDTITLLRSGGVEPVLVKGWAVARLYPDQGLRPYGDIDLCVMPQQYRQAAKLLKIAEGMDYPADLHNGFRNLADESPEELYERSQTVELDGIAVRVAAPEDHLRILALHMLRHGVSRPLWLCDVAVALESRPADFDWDRCLGKNRRRADWVACAIGLAHQLLGARVDDTPVAYRAKNLPEWLVRTALRQWGTPFKARTPMLTYLRRPRGAFKEIRHHWPNAIEATVNMNGPFNALPRLPFQLGDCARRGAILLAQLPKAFGMRR